MDLQLQGKRAFITGGTRGIGLAIAERLGEEGCAVAVCGRQRATLAMALGNLAARGVRAIGQNLDIADLAALRAWTQDAIRELGGLDIYVANASALVLGSHETAWRRAFEVDVMATVHGIDAAIPSLTESAAGAIVVISSMSASEVSRDTDAYGACKAALLPWMKGLAKRLGPSGVRVNTVSPGPVSTEGGAWDRLSRSDPTAYAARAREIPRGRLGTPAEIADLVCFVASPRAAFVSGAILVADGGHSRGSHF